MSEEQKDEIEYDVLYETKKGRWVTIKGTPVFIENGKTIQEAIDALRKEQDKKRKARKRSEDKIVQSCVYDRISTVRDILELKGSAEIVFSTTLYKYRVRIIEDRDYSYEVIEKWKIK